MDVFSAGRGARLSALGLKRLSALGVGWIKEAVKNHFAHKVVSNAFRLWGWVGFPELEEDTFTDEAESQTPFGFWGGLDAGRVTGFYAE